MQEDISLYALRVFATVVQEGGVTRAARRLEVSQPAVSSQLRQLEARLGEPLLQRWARGVRPTRAGEAVAELASQILSLTAQLQAVGPLGLARRVRLYASTTPGTYLVPGLVRSFEGAEVTLSVTNSRRVLEAVETELADVGILGEYPARARRPRDLEWISWRRDCLRLVAASSNPLLRSPILGPADVSEQTLLQREPGSSTRTQADALLGALLHGFRRCLEPGTTEVIKECVVADLGVAVLSSWATRREEQLGLVGVAAAPGFSRERTFYLLRRRDRQQSQAARALLDHLR